MTRSLMKLLLCGVCVAVVTIAPVRPASAQEHWRPPFRDHDVRRFDHRHHEMWRGGEWRHGAHFGRRGWWWVTGGAWYYYDAPVYPYPMIVSEYAVPAAPPGYVPQPPPVVIQQPPPVVVQQPPVVVQPPPTVLVQPAPVPAPPPPPQQQQQVWYYCDNPAGYYPYVPSCASQFRPVPAQQK
ncbi:hypothetical protein [Magnetospirillum fulvum]|uniref:Uncharacterized protein n=1 Tax=Magnetospirillum fulvum TaxID=1082 RepID=A0A1H6HV59_MAGFU|nr:hypothetical protein [Magnetospirillum fulvum]SEH38975.1 hypothetical protein SAMN04244559_02103 [Magnetospirillum fulvum]